MSAKPPTPPKKPKPAELGQASAAPAPKPVPSRAGPAPQLIKLGKVGRPHGLRGAFFIAGRGEALPKAYRQIWIGADPESARPGALTASHMQGDRPVVTCSLAGDRDAAASLVGLLVYGDERVVRAVILSKEQSAADRRAGGDTRPQGDGAKTAHSTQVLPIVDSLKAPPPPGVAVPASNPSYSATILWGDLVGAKVLASCGTEIGTVNHVYNAGASDVIEVAGAGGKLTVDIALIPDMLDVEQKITAGTVRLLVDAATFAELWHEQKPRGGRA